MGGSSVGGSEKVVDVYHISNRQSHANSMRLKFRCLVAMWKMVNYGWRQYDITCSFYMADLLARAELMSLIRIGLICATCGDGIPRVEVKAKAGISPCQVV